MQYLRISILFSGIVSCLLTIAQIDPKSKTIMDNSWNKFRSIAKMTATIKIKTEGPNIQKAESKVGKAIVSGNKYRITFSTEGREIICDEKAVYSYDKKSNEVTISEYSEDNADFSLNAFYEQYRKEPKGKYVAEEKLPNGTLTDHIELYPPARKKTNVVRVHLWINKNTHLVEQMKVQDRNQNFTTYTFTDIQINGTVSSSDFIFDASKYPNANIVDLR
ncbi:MAG: outer membrane lipoprotein carrier protein LolA [Bacteroidia bacterium]|nr:outer membrane lipoprotein carrier protein LolA [Bacteroidia bacterium]MDW8345857.1 outer membrane lipoprotein carrier protein LolA [Bacteroidia bacterium]